jgi:hypothetical protein
MLESAEGKEREDEPVSVHAHLVEETLLRRRSVRKVAAVVTLTALSEDVSGRMPPNLLTCVEEGG